MRKWLLLIAVGLGCSIVCLPGLAAASSSVNSASDSSGLSVSPDITQEALTAGQNQILIDQVITNVSSEPLTITAKPQDFGSIGGQISFFSSTKYNSSTNPHGLENSVQISPNQFGLQPKGSQIVQISINNANSLAAGGHYGAIVYTPQLIVSSSKSARIGVIPSVDALIFLSTASGGTQAISLQNIQEHSVAFSVPQSISFLAANSGNTQSTPIGYVSLTDPRGNLIAQSVINNNSSLVLPSSTSLMTVPLTHPSDFFAMPGTYKLTFEYGYSGSTKLLQMTKTFTYINVPLLLLELVGLLLIFWLLKKLYRRLFGRGRKSSSA